MKSKWVWDSSAAVPVVRREDLSHMLVQDEVAQRLNALEAKVEGQRELLVDYRLGRRPSEATFKKIDAADEVLRKQDYR